MIRIEFSQSLGLGAVVDSAGGNEGVGHVGLVDQTFWRFW